MARETFFEAVGDFETRGLVVAAVFEIFEALDDFLASDLDLITSGSTVIMPFLLPRDFDIFESAAFLSLVSAGDLDIFLDPYPPLNFETLLPWVRAGLLSSFDSAGFLELFLEEVCSSFTSLV